MPIKKYMLNVDGKDRQVSEKNINQYGMGSYASSYPNATVRMRDDDGADYDIPIADYDKAVNSGLHPFITTYYDSNEKIDATQPSDSVAYMPQVEPAPAPVAEKPQVKEPTDTVSVKPQERVVTNAEKNAWEEYQRTGNGYDPVTNTSSGGTGTQAEADSIFDARQSEWQARQREKSGEAKKVEDDTQGKKVEDDTETRKDREPVPSVWENMPDNSFAAHQEARQRELAEPVNEWQGAPSLYPETKGEALIKPEIERQQLVENIWNSELKEKVDALIKEGHEQGLSNLMQHQERVYGENAPWHGTQGYGFKAYQEYAKGADAKRVIDGVQEYLSSKQASSGAGGGEGETAPDPMQERLMQKVYDYLVQQNTPKNTAEYILKTVFDSSITGQLLGLGNGKSYEQRQIEAQGLQQYDASGLEEVGAMAASIVSDLPVMAVTGGIGSAAGNTLLRGATNRLMASGMSEAAARAIATRAAQQGAMKWGLRTASEALNFGTLEATGSAVGQLYQTGEVDLGDVAQSFAKGTATGAIMGVFGVSNDNFRRMMEGAVGETAGRAIGYGTSLSGRTAILTGSSVMGQYLTDPNFDIHNVDWTQELSHSALMNIGFDILGAAKRYQAERKTGIKMRDLEKLNLTKEDIAQLNRAGVNGKNAQGIAESIMQTKDAAELRKGAETGEGLVGNDWAAIEQELALNKDAGVMGELLGNPNIDLQTKAKVAYLMTGIKFNLSPSTNISDVQEQADGSFVVEKYDPSGQVNETRRFTTREAAEKARYELQNEVKPNQVNVLEGMMNDAGKTASAIRIFEMVAKQFGVSKEQITAEYVRGKNGEPLEGDARRAYEMLDNLLKSVVEVEDYHYSTEQLKRRMDEGYGEESGWMDHVLKKRYNSLTERERQSYDEYVSNMQLILQGENAQREGLGGGETASKTEGEFYPMLEGRQPEIVPGAGPVEGPAPTPSSPREVSRQAGAALYAEHDPAKMRQAVVREQVARERAVAAGVSEETLEGLAKMDDAALEEATAAMDANTQRIVGDWISQRELVDGLNTALDDAHAAEVEEARIKASSMATAGGYVRMVELGKYGDSDHTYGVIVSGIDGNGQLTDRKGLCIVVPLANSEGGFRDFNSFDMNNHITGTFKGQIIYEVETDAVLETLLKDYESDANLLEAPKVVPGQTVLIADMDGNTSSLHILAKGPGDSWIVQEDGMRNSMEISSEELAELTGNAERLPIMQEYAEMDAQYEQEQTAIRRQQEQQEKELKRQQERAERKAAEEAEAARIAAEMAKPINRLAKYPEGHPKAGQPDYENSKPEDVLAYFGEWMSPEETAKSVISFRKNLEGQVATKEGELAKLIKENEDNDYFPDEAIKAKQYIDSKQQELNELKKSLDYWKKLERMAAGPSQEELQSIVNRSEAVRKAQRSKAEGYKPSKEYTDMQKAYADSPDALDILNDLEPHTPEELAAGLLASGVRLMKSDETVGGAKLRGVMSMTGYGSRDLGRMNFIFATRADGGISVEEFGEMLESSAQEYGIRFDGKTTEEGVTALLNLLGEVEKMGDIIRYVENRRMEEATAMYDAENDAIEQMKEEAAWKEYSMSYADLQLLQESITEATAERQRFYEEFKKSDDYIEFINTFAKNNEYGIERNDDTGREGGDGTVAANDATAGQRPVGRSDASAGSILPLAEMGEGQQPVADLSRGTAEERGRDGNVDNSPLPDGSGAGETEGRTAVSAEALAESRKLVDEAISTVGSEIQSRPINVVSTKEDIEALRQYQLGEEVIADLYGEFDNPNVFATFVPALNELFIWNNHVAERRPSKNDLEAAIYHENVHSLMKGGRYSRDEFIALADAIRQAFPDIDEFVTNRYGKEPAGIQAEEVVSKYVQDLVESGMKKELLDGSLRVEGDTDFIAKEINEVINLIKDRTYERRTGSKDVVDRVRTESQDREGRVGRPSENGAAKSESVSSVGERGSDGNGEESGMAGRPGLHAETSGAVQETGTKPRYTVEKRHHAQQNKDIWAVKFEERYDRDKFLELKDKAREFGGYYSRFGKGGFIFKNEEDARRFGESVVGVEAKPAETAIEQARAEVNTNPTEAQKEAGNYKMGHVKVDGYDITIENPKGSVRSGKDANGTAWSITMNNDYGYIRGTKAIDGDHIDVFLSDTPEEGAVFVVDQAKEDGSFDESKVMYGFSSLEEARDAYLSNYSTGWENRILAITEVSKDEFKKWIDSSTRKTKAFSEYKSVKPEGPKQINIEGLFGALRQKGETKLSEHEVADNKESVIDKEYDEQGRETIESQAGHSASQAAELGNQAEAGSLEDAPATGRGSGTSGNRPVASRSERPTQVNGYRLGEKVVYKGKEATIFDFENDGTPVLDTGMAPVIYEVGHWEDIQKLPVSSEQAISMAQARTPKKQLERAEQRQKREAPKREKQKQQMADLFAQVDALDETLVRQEQEVDAQLALMAEYKAGPKAQVREDMHTGAAKTLEKAARKLAKSLANRLGGHVDGKDLTRGLTNIAPVGGDVTIRVWLDDTNTNGVLLNINFDAMPDTRDFDKLVTRNGYWRLISDKDTFGVRSTNRNFAVPNVDELESGAFLSKLADDMLSEINRFAGQNRNNEPTNEVLTLKEEKDGRRNQAENQGVGTEAREETERAERGRDGGSVHGDNVPDAEGSRGISGSDGEQQSSVTQSVKRNSNNFSYGETHLELPTGEIGKLKGNIEAIRTLKELEASGQPATAEQKQALLKFVGWGGLAEALNSAEYADWQRKLDGARRWGWDLSTISTPWSKKWGKHYEELRPLMTDEEWASAQASTLNTHYTPETVIRGLWDALEYMGFRGGKIQEPAMGIGHMVGFMPKSMSERSVITGFELDGVPGRIAQQLYPDAVIHVAGYETQYKPNSQDAIVTNVPFGQTAPIDPALDKTLRRKIGGAYNLHNYFIVKGLLELKPGGVGAFITSAATMDGRNTKAREYIAGLGVDLIGAIRLPNTTFSKNAGTEVTADILFFRKRLPGEPSNGVNFVSLSQVGTGTYKGKDKNGNDALLEVPLFVNEYFAQHPEMMLGTVMTAHDAGSGGLYGGDSQTLVARPGTELSAELADAIGRLPENSLAAKGTAESTSAPSLKEATAQKNGTLSVKSGKVYVADKGELTEVASGTFKHEGRTRSYADAATDYLALKETLKALIKAEQTQKEDPAALRKQLNDQYNEFVSKYGQLNENKALNPILEEDYERFLAQSLERVETIVNPNTGRRTKVVSKGDGILEKRVSQPMMEPERADNLQDAIGISQSYRGRMDVDYIARMTGMTADEARERILQEHEAYEDPVTGDLIDRDAYLSGNIREKLETARTAAENDERFAQNVADLEASMPETIPFVDISYKIGTPWIPETVYEEFANDVLGIKNVKVRYIPAADEFALTGGYVDDYTKSADYSTTARKVTDLFNDAVNLRKPTIYKQLDKDHRVKDEAATQEAVSRIMDMNDAFIRYIQEREDLHTRLQSIYNDRYNNYRLREYRAPNFKGTDGKVHYPGANPAITLRGHQVKAVQRSLQGSTLLAHQVGTGKTFTMITTAMEMRRLGLAKKPMIVVQNATLNDFAADFLKLYPGANILVPNETERSASQRKRLFNLIATGDFDAVIVPQSFLAFIPDDEGRKKAVIQARVDEIMAAAEALAVTDRRLADRLKREAKAMELALNNDEANTGEIRGRKLSVKKQAKKEESAVSRETRKLDRRTDDVLTFEQMGIDALFIDEAHNFKKIGFSTKMQNVKGVDTGYSERANSLYLKVSYVQERNGGRNVILATGTPITNTMAEVWTMMRFVAPEILEDYNIKTFDEFAATFGQVEPSLEQNSTGGFKIADRFKSYVNVPELVKAFRSHADVVLTGDVSEFQQGKNIPKLKDGHMTNHVIRKSEKLEEVMDVLVEALKEDEKKVGSDKRPGLPLVVFSKAKQAAIDLRLINPEYPDDPDSKTNKVVSEVMRIYRESTPDKGIQMIFCDSYQSPSSEPAIDLFDYDPNVPQFNLYRDIKQKLIEQGIPKEEIVIVSEISNAERKKAVFEKARKGDVRVLIGGTEKMGVGVNVQDRMIALHHMDAPIRPMDFEQRNGRILRQGNMFAAMDKPVEVVTYGVEGTLDATAYERLRIKQDFINQMMKGDVSGRVMEERDDEDPSGKTFAQMAAELSGDKTLQLLFVAENDVKKLEGLRRSHEMKRQYAREELSSLKSTLLFKEEKELKEAEAIAQAVAQEMPEGIVKLTANGKSFTEKLASSLAEIAGAYEEQYALNRGTLPVTIKINGGLCEMVLHHELGQLAYSLYVGPYPVAENKAINTFSGIWLSVNSALSGAGKKPAVIKESIADMKKRIKGAESIIDKPFDKMDELKAAQQKVRELKEELAKKASESERGTVDVKAAKKRLKSEGKIISLPEEMAGDSEESLDRMVTAMQPFESVAVNAPEMVIAQSTSDILKAMPGIGSLQFAAIVREASRPEVQAMYVPWTRQIILLPNKGTVKEMRDKRWHESLHFGIDMVMPKDDAGRLMMERAGSEVDQLSPELAAWVKDTYGDRDIAEEKVVHLVEEFISYLEDTGKVRSILDGVDFGEQYPVLNDVVNKVINYLTNNGHGKESDNYRGYDEGREPTYRGEGEEGRFEEDFAAVRNEQRIKEERIEIGFTPQEIAEMETPILQSKGGFKNLSEGEAWAKKNLQGKSETNRFTGEEISIGKKAIDEMFHPKFTKTVGEQEHLKALMSVLDFIREGIPGEIHVDTHGRDFNVMRLYNAIEIDNEIYRVKSTVKKVKQGERYYTYELQEMELIEETPEALGLPRGTEHMPQLNSTNSITGAKLLKNVKKTNSDDEILPKNEVEVKLGLRGKPRRKQGESLISFNKRLKEWQAEMDAAKKKREVENLDAVNPIDEELNELAMEMMNHPSPTRKRGESDADFNVRQAEWIEWYNTRLPEINARMSELKAELERQSSDARTREIDETEDPLYRGEVPPQKDDTGELTDDEMREVREIFQEKMKDAQISVSKDQIRRDIKQEIIERRRYIETSNLEDAFFVDEVRKVSGSEEVLRAIPDYIEGTYTGEVTPELVNAAKMVSDWFEEVYNLMAQEGVLYDAPKIQNYVTHIWDWKRSPKEAQERYTNWVNTMRLRSPFTKHRVIPSYKEGIAMGMVPKYDDITGILMEYGHYASETIANKRMLEFLKNFKVFVEGGKDNLPMEVDVIVPDKVKDPMYSRMNHTALDGYKVLNIVKPYITPVFGDQRIIDPSHLNPLTNKLIDGVWATSGLMKKIALSFSFFHHGALTETAVAMMKPWNTAKVIAKDLIWDVIMKGNIPALNKKEAARDAVKHLVSLGASNDYVTADVNALTTQLHRWTKDKHIPVAQQAAHLLDFLNKGSDKILWDTVHDGFKIASFEKMAKEVRAKAEREGWSQQQLDKVLDECGHLVNDTFGGLHFDILGFSPKSVRIMRALLLSPDWTLATIRQALSPLGFGKLYGDEGFWRTVFAGESPVKMRKKYGRDFWITAMIFFYALMNGLNAYFRVKDEDEMKQDANDMRRVDPDYKSPYELAYPNGMKWYDYTMPGNTLSHQTHLFTGRYDDGTERYARWGKQFRELPELFFGRDGFSFPGPMIDKLSGKANPLLSTVFEFVSGYSLSGWENAHMKDKKGWERDVARLHLLASKFVPYSVPTQEDKDFYWLDLVMPSSKGFSPGKAISYFEKAILSGDMNYVAGVYNACVINGLQPEKYFNAAKARIEAEAKSESLEDVETLQDATKKFDEATDVKERKRLLRYMEQQIGAQDYRAISQEEMLQQATDLRNGENPEVKSNDRYLELSTSVDVTEDYRMKMNAAGLKKYYQDYTGLAAEDPESAKRMYQQKRKYIEGYAVTTKYRSAINKLKKALTREGVDEDKIIKEIRKLRKEYFDTMDRMELK